MRAGVRIHDRGIKDGQVLDFDAVLYPHRSLSRNGFIIMMAIFGASVLVMGLIFVVVGAWPIFGFLGLDVILIYVAFRLSYRSARAYEAVRLSPNALEVIKVTPKGQEWRAVFQPHWLRVAVREPVERDGRLIISSHGKSLEIGAFLSHPEKQDFAEALRRALERARRPSHLQFEC